MDEDLLKGEVGEDSIMDKGICFKQNFSDIE